MSKLIAGLVASLFAVSAFAAQNAGLSSAQGTPTVAPTKSSATLITDNATTPAKKSSSKKHKKAKKAAAADAGSTDASAGK